MVGPYFILVLATGTGLSAQVDHLSPCDYLLALNSPIFCLGKEDGYSQFHMEPESKGSSDHFNK